MARKVSIILVGAGGYGNIYLGEMLKKIGDERFSIAGIVDPAPQGCRYLAELKELGVPFFSTIEEFYAENTADLAVIFTYTLSPNICYAMTRGSNVSA